MRLVNLTPHDLTLYLTDGSRHTLPSAGTAARVQVVVHPTGTTVCGVPVVVESAAGVVGLPAAEPGVLRIVSRRVLEACLDRHDLVAPGDLVRAADGRVVGCRTLVVNPGR